MSKRRPTEKQVKEINASVDLPPMPKMVYEGPAKPKWLIKECQRCGKQFETTIASAIVVQCRHCWFGRNAPKPNVLKYKLKGLKCKKNLPK